ncbi:transglutaminase TgpA family protein [Sutcliffiella halmapala]|uniref:transglutaminase TgpA family protein n=1 Tax=Sutcliffiella halmapala TaxID=79882 RepID=UPI00099538E7|nr:transglutaminase domain-containing protein [Sutcliffiella halmapala]
MAASNPYQRNVYALLMHIFGFVLLLEWVLPLEQVTDTANIYVFIVFLMVAFVLSFLQIIPLLSFFVQVGFMFYFLHVLYMPGVFLGKEWFSFLWQDLQYNFDVIWAADWSSMTGLFRSLLLFILLWLVSYLVIYWILYRKQMLLFVVFTVTYVAILDTFTVYQGNMAIVRLMVVGLLIVGFVHMERLKEKEGIYRSSKMLLSWGIPLTIFVLFSATVGYLSPKAAPIWPDPVPFLTSFGEGNGVGTGGVKKIGYGENDSRLGGPFIPDDSVVFQAEVTQRHYWRVETKDIYTGKGWNSTDADPIPLEGNNNTVISWLEEGVSTTPLTANLQMEKTYPHLSYPLGFTSVETEEETIFEIDPVTEKISTKNLEEDSINLEEYQVNYNYPRYYIEALKSAVPGTGLESEDEFLERYTQLPNSMPERVRELAVDITNSYSNRYDKVTAVERYFRNNGFSYNTTDVAVPSGQEDYVDQFLFETQQGYCDNFSTAMIALLRAVDIPARWVKGYTEGEFIDSTEESKRIFEITNNNAHSWVEVYYPEVGWVTYEPTSGFSNPYSFIYEATEGNTGNNSEEQIPEQAETPEQGESLTPEPGEEENAEEVGASKTQANTFDLQLSMKEIFISISAFIALFLLVFFTQNKWKPYVYIARFKRRRDDKVFGKAYNILLKHFHTNGLIREEGQTLREYAKYIDNFYRGNEMQTLTSHYERVLYRGDSSEEEWEKSVELWENLIKRASS